MDIVLPPETQRLLEERRSSGTYPSVDDVVHAALCALGEAETRGLDDETLDAIDRAEDQIERGECRDWKDVRSAAGSTKSQASNHKQT